MNGLKSSSAIFFGRPHWCSLSSRPGHDDRAAGEVDALAEQVLPEAALLALEHVGERLQRPLVGAGDDPAAPAVVEERVDRFLQHPLLVADDDVGRAQFDQPLQAVVAVDDAAVEVVEVGRGEAAAVERDERAQLRRDHRDDGEDHPLGAVARLAEGLDQLQPLDDLLGLQLAGRLGEVGAQLLGLGLEVDGGQHLADRLGADAGAEGVLAELVDLVEELVLVEELAVLEIGQARLDHDVLLEVEDALEVAQRHVEHQADARRQRLQEPDVRDRRGELDVAHALAPDLLQRHFHAALLADDAAILHPLVLAAQALVVLDRTEDARAEEAVPLRLERAVVDGLGLLDLAERPRENPLRARQRDLDLVEGPQRRDRGERVGDFLVHGSNPQKRDREGEGAGRPHSASESKSSMLRPSERISLTRTLNDSGTPASKLSSPLTIDS